MSEPVLDRVPRRPCATGCLRPGPTWGIVPGLALVLLVLLGGCMGSQPKERLAKTVHAMNQQTRWGRIASAAAMVDPAYKVAFLKAHAGWGEEMQMADSEVVQVEMAPNQEVAVALIAYSWYSLRTMTLHNTVVQQEWVRKKDADHYTLAAETVIKGDPALLQVADAEDVATAPVTPEG